MDENLDKSKKILEEYNQEHLLMFYDELNDNEKERLVDQILSIDFEEIIALYKNSFNDDTNSDETITPLPYIDKSKLSNDEIEYYKNIGIRSIKNGEYAVVTMAGGQGTRLGHNGPKGTFELDLAPKKKSLFEILNDGLKLAQEKYSVTISWYIMTSQTNDIATKRFFKDNDYFGYPSDKIHFFIQEKLPLTDTEGKLLLAEPYQIKEASNGNGNIYASLRKHGILEEFRQNNIKWCFIGGIDNVLVRIVDPLFLGLTISTNNEIASKTVFKEYPNSNDCVFCNKNDKPSILDYEMITPEMSEKTDENGNYLYRDVNVLCHLLSTDAIEKSSNLDLPYHRAFKKNIFINSEGVKQIPDKPNSFKFETFIFDAFSHFDNMLLFRIEKEEEFAPIKNSFGATSPEAATKLYIRNNENN